MLAVFLLSSASNWFIRAVGDFMELCKEDRFEVVNSLPIGVLFKDAWICELLSLLLEGFSVNGKVNNLRGQYSEMSLAHLYNN